MKAQGISQMATDGVVLRTRDIGRANRTVSILTREYGVVDAFANGARNAKSRLVAVAQPFAYSSFILSKRGETYTVHSGEVRRIFFGIREDMEKLALAFYFAELALVLGPKGAGASLHLRLLLNSLHYLEKDLREPTMVKAVYELRLLALSGYMPDLVGCADCGKFEDDSLYFYPRSGEIRCEACGTSHVSPAGRVHMTIAALSAMRHIIYADFEELFQFQLTGPSLEQAVRACEEYVLEHTERGYKSLEFYRSACV